MERGLDVNALFGVWGTVREHIESSDGADAGKGKGMGGVRGHFQGSMRS